MKKILIASVFGLFLWSSASAQVLSILRGSQGGTNYGTTTAGNIGNCLKVSSVSPLVWTIGSCGGGGAQTPWTSAIDGGGYALTNAGAITAVRFIATSSTSTFNGLSFSTATGTSLILSASSTFSILHLGTALEAISGGTGLSSFASSSLLMSGTGNTWEAFATSSLGVLLSDTYGTLLGTRGGTGLTSTASSSILFGNSSNGYVMMATSALGINVTDLKAAATNGQVLAYLNGGWTSAATTTAGTGLTYTGSAFNVNNSQSIATLSNLTTNGFIQTSGSNGTLGVQVYPCTGIQGCTGFATIASSSILIGGTGNTWSQMATSTLGINGADIKGDLPFSNLAQVSANSVLGNVTGATADAASIATSSLYAPGTAGNVLMWDGTGWRAYATATCAAITGSSALCDGNDASAAAYLSGTSTTDWIVYKTGGTTNVYDTINGTVPKSGTFDQVMNYIVNAATSTNPSRVSVAIRAGVYDCNASIGISGGGSRFGPDLIFEGAASSTTIIVNTAKCFNFSQQATVVFKHVAAAFTANSNVLFYASSTGTTVQSSIRESTFEDINGFSTTTGHTGFIFDFIDDFRNNYTNIMGDQVGNCWRSTNNYANASFINGDSHFYGFNFCEINNSGVGIAFEVKGVNGIVNQDVFDDINGISNDTSAWNDIFFKVTSAQSITVLNGNAEQFATNTQIFGTAALTSKNNSFSSNKYIIAHKGVFETDKFSYNNTFSCSRIDTTSPDNVNIVSDSVSVATYGYREPNIFQGVNGGACNIDGSATEVYFLATSSSMISRMYDNVNGTTQTYNNMGLWGDKLVFNLQQGTRETGYFFEKGNASTLAWNYGSFASPLQAMTLNTSGNLGIGTTSPYAKLSVVGETVSQFFTATSTTATSTFNGYVLVSGRLVIPQGSNPTITDVGVIALDTTNNDLLIGTSTNSTYPAVVRTQDQVLYRFKVASTSQSYASSSMDLPTDVRALTITGVTCFVEGGTSVVINLSDANGTNDTNTVTCSATKPTTISPFTTNNTWTAGEEIRNEWGTKTGTIDYVNITLYGNPTRT